MLRRIKYYLTSIPTILTQISNWYMLFPLWLRRRPLVIKLKNGSRFKVRSLMDVWVIKEACLDRDYVQHCAPLHDGWTVIDIGTGLGEFSIHVAKELPHSQVYACEPFPESFELLEENLKLNAVQNVHAAQVAIGSASGKLTLATTGAAVQHTTTSSTLSGHAKSTLEVRALSLDDLFKTYNLTQCDLLKIDCEGFEFEILFNATAATLKNIARISLEYHDGFTEFSHGDLVDYLRQHDFTVKIIPSPVHNYLGLLYASR